MDENLLKKEEEVTKKVPETVPYSVFSEKIGELNDLKSKLKNFEELESQKKLTDLEEKGKYETALNSLKEQHDSQLKELQNQLFENKKNSILSKYNISGEDTKLVLGSTEEEIEANAKYVSERLSIKKIEKLPEKETDKTKKVIFSDKNEKPKLTGQLLKQILNGDK